MRRFIMGMTMNYGNDFLSVEVRNKKKMTGYWDVDCRPLYATPVKWWSDAWWPIKSNMNMLLVDVGAGTFAVRRPKLVARR